MKQKPIVAIVGRPNVGKSTLVNRLIGHRNSIVDDRPGVTRDRIYFDVEWQNKLFTVIDTGGIVPGDEDEIMLSIYDQAKIACDEADKIIFVVDGKDGVHPVDEDIANSALDILKIDEFGLDTTDRSLLKLIIEKYDGGPVGIETIAAAIGEDVRTLEDVCEPYLLQSGLLQRTPRGRKVSPAAYRHLNCNLSKYHTNQQSLF